jgi:hypothetical protein
MAGDFLTNYTIISLSRRPLLRGTSQSIYWPTIAKLFWNNPAQKIKAFAVASEIRCKLWISRNMQQTNSLDEGRLMMIDWRMVWLNPQANCVLPHAQVPHFSAMQEWPMSKYLSDVANTICQFHQLLLTLWSWVLGKPPVVQPLNNFPTFYRTRRFIAVFIRALH